jgi:hypothetical protein
MNKARLLKKLDRFFTAHSNPITGLKNDLSNWRYVPQGFSNRGSGWGVFDRVQNRFLTDGEAWKLSDDELLNERITVH